MNDALTIIGIFIFTLICIPPLLLVGLWIYNNVRKLVVYIWGRYILWRLRRKYGDDISNDNDK